MGNISKILVTSQRKTDAELFSSALSKSIEKRVGLDVGILSGCNDIDTQSRLATTYQVAISYEFSDIESERELFFGKNAGNRNMVVWIDSPSSFRQGYEEPSYMEVDRIGNENFFRIVDNRIGSNLRWTEMRDNAIDKIVNRLTSKLDWSKSTITINTRSNYIYDESLEEHEALHTTILEYLKNRQQVCLACYVENSNVEVTVAMNKKYSEEYFGLYEVVSLPNTSFFQVFLD